MAQEHRVEASIGIGDGVDLQLWSDKTIVAYREGPGRLYMSIPLCKATDEGVENLKAYIDRLLTVA
jgi:hypothetical protein